MKYNLFFAIVPSVDIQRRIAQTIDTLEAKRSPNIHIDWTFERDFHATIQYIPNVDEQHILSLAQSFSFLSECSKFMCRVSHAKLFGNALTLTLEPQSQFFNLNQKCHKKLGALFQGGYIKQQRKNFIPHITIGRIKQPKRLLAKDEQSLMQRVQTQFSDFSFLAQQACCMQRLPESLRKGAQLYWQHKKYMLK